MVSSNSQIDKPHHGCPKRAVLPDVNINTGAQSINTESCFKMDGGSYFYKGEPLQHDHYKHFK